MPQARGSIKGATGGDASSSLDSGSTVIPLADRSRSASRSPRMGRSSRSSGELFQ
jgi:hypothetical protein